MTNKHQENIKSSEETAPQENVKQKVDKESLQHALRIFDYIRPYRWYLFAGLILLFLSSLVFMIGQMLDIASGESDLDLDLNGVLVVLVIVLAV